MHQTRVRFSHFILLRFEFKITRLQRDDEDETVKVDRVFFKKDERRDEDRMRSIAPFKEILVEDTSFSPLLSTSADAPSASIEYCTRPLSFSYTRLKSEKVAGVNLGAINVLIGMTLTE